jgi:putative transposase
VKKKRVFPPEAQRELIELAPPQSRLARPWDLVGLPRATSDSQTQGESAANLTLMRWLDQQDTDTPDDGVRRMTAWVRSQGDAVHHKRVARLRRTMGVETLYPRPRLRAPHPAHRVSPSL